MCFRPDDIGGVNTCPACGQLNPSIAPKCIKCGAELPNGEGDEMPVEPSIAAPAAPAAPRPVAPPAPQAPKN